MANVASGTEATLGRKGAGVGADGVGLPEGAADHDGIAKGIAPPGTAQDGLGIDGDNEAAGVPLNAYALVGECCP